VAVRRVCWLGSGKKKKKKGGQTADRLAAAESLRLPHSPARAPPAVRSPAIVSSDRQTSFRKRRLAASLAAAVAALALAQRGSPWQRGPWAGRPASSSGLLFPFFSGFRPARFGLAPACAWQSPAGACAAPDQEPHHLRAALLFQLQSAPGCWSPAGAAQRECCTREGSGSLGWLVLEARLLLAPALWPGGDPSTFSLAY